MNEKRKVFVTRMIIVILATILMGFCLSFLLLIDLGTDPCTMMNNAISSKIGLSIGNWQAIFNVVLLVVVVAFGEKNLGIGTLANMFLVGYSIDFFTWLWKRLIPQEVFGIWYIRIIILIVAMVIFVLSAAVYMDVHMGVAPYDAIPVIISSKLKKVPFKVIRIVFDLIVTLIGFVFGGSIEIITILMVLFLGPVISMVGALGTKKFPKIFGEKY